MVAMDFDCEALKFSRAVAILGWIDLGVKVSCCVGEPQREMSEDIGGGQAPGGIRKVPREIKQLGKAELVALAQRARGLNLGVGRRADWIAEHIVGRAAFMRAILYESSPQPCYRTLVLAPHRDGCAEHFPLDVLPGDFAALPDVSPVQLLSLTWWALDRVPISDLPLAYEAEWDRGRPG